MADGSGSEGRLTTLAGGQSTTFRKEGFAWVLARPFAKQPFLAIGGLTQRSGSARVIDFPVLGLHRCKKREFEALSADPRDDVLNHVALVDFEARECCRDSGIWFYLQLQDELRVLNIFHVIPDEFDLFGPAAIFLLGVRADLVGEGATSADCRDQSHNDALNVVV